MLNDGSLPLILGSRSPQRLELLSQMIPPSRIKIVVPEEEAEAGFDGRETMESILSQLTGIARTKNEAVRRQLAPGKGKTGSRSITGWSAILTADTIVIATEADARSVVLGKPDGPEWEAKTRSWFLNYYSGKTHRVATAICVRTPEEMLLEQCVLTDVTFSPIDSRLLEWYLSTREPLGKAGGYGLQGAASLFVTAMDGSPSNVIGLPMRETWDALLRAGVFS